jgi:isocitrate dehydrogenase kinase/phosphatase
MLSLKNLSKNIAITVLTGFNRHFSISQKTKVAQVRFVKAYWNAERLASRKLILFYDVRVKDAPSVSKNSSI